MHRLAPPLRRGEGGSVTHDDDNHLYPRQTPNAPMPAAFFAASVLIGFSVLILFAYIVTKNGAPAPQVSAFK